MKKNLNSKLGLLQNKLFQSSLIVFVLLVGSGLFLSLGTGLFAQGLFPPANAVVYTGSVVFTDDFKFQGELFDYFAEGNPLDPLDNRYLIAGWGEYVSSSVIAPIAFPGNPNHTIVCDILATVCGSSRYYVVKDKLGATHGVLKEVLPTNIAIQTMGVNGNFIPVGTSLGDWGSFGTCYWGSWKEAGVYKGIAYVAVSGLTVNTTFDDDGDPLTANVTLVEPFPISYGALSYKCWETT